MEEVVHPFEIFKTILFQFFQAREGTFLTGQCLELFEFVLNRLNLDFYPNEADTLPVPPHAVAGARLSATFGPLRPRRPSHQPQAIAARLPCWAPFHASPLPPYHVVPPRAMPLLCSTSPTPLKWVPPPPAPPFPLLPHSLPHWPCGHTLSPSPPTPVRAGHRATAAPHCI
jgi:hypothetical protein